MADNNESVNKKETAAEAVTPKKTDNPPKKDTAKKSDKNKEKSRKKQQLEALLKDRTPFEAKLIKRIFNERYGLVDKSLLSKDKEVIFTTMRILGELRVDKYVDPIAQVVSDAADPEFRKAAANSLALMKNNRSLFQLIKRMEIEQDPEVKDAIMNAVRSIHNKGAEAE